LISPPRTLRRWILAAARSLVAAMVMPSQSGEDRPGRKDQFNGNDRVIGTHTLSGGLIVGAVCGVSAALAYAVAFTA
jgi:hypothetical protein